ncbi:hypothetical protein L1987_56421 [Smallanthus sonchifolius]|uniref:Uncharacterized protein n=1 Tax=Smallanthus sonchifolius TaxID=185202 RepID=A0ACB9ECD1_9ASTR|nr:hypothetical protein L1987_56421 [Smallanthus sonchifolius]
MAMKSIFLITVLVLVLVATQAEAQILPPIRIPPLPIPPIGIPPLPIPPVGVPPLGVPPIGVGGLLNISGIVSCSVNASVNGTTPPPPFPNATVELSCDGTVLASATTNQSGAFTISVNALQIPTILTSSCKLVVATPLSTCNATLPSTGSLQAPLQIVRNVVNGVLTVTALIPQLFVFLGAS